jgi:hypothetical protein
VVSTANAVTVVAALARHVADRRLRADRIWGAAAGAEFWWAEICGYFTSDLILSLRCRKTLSNVWGNVFHHVVCLLSFGCVLARRRLAWYACAIIMLETTTPFGNFRWIMAKSDSPSWGRSSTLYKLNGTAWLLAFLVMRVLSIPWLLRCALLDALVLRRSLTATASDKRTFAFLLSAYLMMVPLNLWWFSKMLKGALKLFIKGVNPEEALEEALEEAEERRHKASAAAQ